MKRFFAWMLILILLPSFALAAGTLSNGSQGEAVRSLQQRLRELDLMQGKADGIYGKQTAAAVSEAQRLLAAAGYEVEQTGKADRQTQMLLFDAEAEDALLTLRRGSSGERVRSLQNRLIDLKLLSGTADGKYGAQTEEAIIAFQQALSLPVDGAVSPDTLALLSSDLSQYGFQAPIYFDESNPLALTANDLYASACILIDAPSGEVLFEHAADERRYPASTTKIMSLLLALEQCDLDERITIPKSAADIPKDSSLVPVSPGEKMTMRELLYGLMIRSGNDAANAVAELVSGSVDAFVVRMNERAAELGLTGTHFTNPHGYHDEEHYSTARDLAAMARLGLTDATFCEMVTCLQYTLSPTSKRGELVLENTYEIFDPASEHYIPGTAGIKSGYTSAAGFCYVGAAQRDGRTLIAVILGVPGRNRGWADLSKLFEYGFAK